MEDQAASHALQIAVRGLVKRYHYHPVLNKLSLEIERGAFCILVGLNGAGKTTLLRILASLSRADEGRIWIGGQLLGTSPLLRKKIGYISHHTLFYQDLTAIENLRHYARLYALQEIDEKIQAGIQSAGLTRAQHQPVRTFSRGMQQRLSIARALLHDPDILLFDEPYTGLDQEAAQALDHKLNALHQADRTILLAAHRPQRLISIASHVAWLNDGKIVQHIPISRLADSPDLYHYLQEAA